MNKGWGFVTDCTRSTAPKIIAMTQAEREITWPTFRRYVPVEEVRRIFPYYSYHGEVRNPATGEIVAARHLKDDLGVGFFKSSYEGKPCVFIRHSWIEYIFQAQEE